jgi:hypothetical protein
MRQVAQIPDLYRFTGYCLNPPLGGIEVTKIRSGTIRRKGSLKVGRLLRAVICAEGSPARRRACVEHVIAEHGVSERFACRVLGQHRSTQRKAPTTPGDEAALTADIIALATQYGRYPEVERAGDGE